MFDIGYIMKRKAVRSLLYGMLYLLIIFGVVYGIYWLADHNHLNFMMPKGDAKVEQPVYRVVHTNSPETKKNAIVNLEGMRYVVIEYTSSCEVQFSSVKIVMPESKE